MIFAERVVPRVLTALTVGIVFILLVIHEAGQSKVKQDAADTPQANVFSLAARRIMSVFTMPDNQAGSANESKNVDRRRRSVPVVAPLAQNTSAKPSLNNNVPSPVTEGSVNTTVVLLTSNVSISALHCSNLHDCDPITEILVMVLLVALAILIVVTTISLAVRRRRRRFTRYSSWAVADDDVLNFVSLVRQHSKHLRKSGPAILNPSLHRTDSEIPLLRLEDSSSGKKRGRSGTISSSASFPMETPLVLYRDTRVQEPNFPVPCVTYAIAGVQPASQQNSLEALTPNRVPVTQVQPQ